MRERFIDRKFKQEQIRKIATAIDIINRYAEMNLTLTLRQLYYQFVAHHDLPNNEKSYKTLGKLISDARLAGFIDWDAIEDRGRVPDVPSAWDNINELVEIAIKQFRLDRWKDQEYYVELWVEKQALAGVLEPVARSNHVTLMVNKGYSSQSAMYASAQRYRRNTGKYQQPVLLYLGDHDPSGEDMVRDVGARLTMFGVDELIVTKVALTMDQIEEYGPPPNPAKLSDSRAAAYIEKFGDESWEVDALDPETLVDLIQTEINQYLNQADMEKVIFEEVKQKDALKRKLKIK